MNERLSIGCAIIIIFLTAAMTSSAENVPVLSDAEAWKTMPPAEYGEGQPLPVWIRILARSLPRTAAAMLELDYTQRLERALPLHLRAKLRWIAAKADRCAYAQEYARADYLRAGGKAEDLDLFPDRLENLPKKERLALQVVKKLCEEAYAVSDQEIARLIELYDEDQAVAIVLVAAYANFQDRLLLALGVNVEKGGPLVPVKVRFRRPAPITAAAPNSKDAKDHAENPKPKRALTPPAVHPPPIPEKIDDAEWTAFPMDSLKQKLKQQMERRKSRIPIPEWETVKTNLPDGVPQPEKPTRIRWSLVTLGYQPRLSAAWSQGLRAFRQDSDLDAVYHESLFWIVTRSLQCFY